MRRRLKTDRLKTDRHGGKDAMAKRSGAKRSGIPRRKRGDKDWYLPVETEAELNVPLNAEFELWSQQIAATGPGRSTEATRQATQRLLKAVRS